MTNINLDSGPVAQLVRAPACHAGGRRFEPVWGRQIVLSISIKKIDFASVAQSVEHETENLSVGGSIPPRGTKLLVWLNGRASDL